MRPQKSGDVGGLRSAGYATPKLCNPWQLKFDRESEAVKWSIWCFCVEL